MIKPVLLLDIDGVVNSLLSAPPAVKMSWPLDAWKTGVYSNDTHEFPLLWAEHVVSYLTGLHDAGRVEVRWHTTWQEQAPQFGKIVGLPEFEVQDAPEARANQGLFMKQQIIDRRPHWWKYPAAERVLTVEGRPLIWIDDDLELKLARRYRDDMRKLGRVCLVSPDGQTGLLGKHMRQVEEFLASWEEARGAVSGS